MNKLIILSGCSGGGKSTLLSALKKQGYEVIPEMGRQIVKEQLALGGKLTPWDNPLDFCELLIKRSIEAYNHAEKLVSKDNLIFFDRSFLDGICYYQTHSKLDPHKYDHFIRELKFYHLVFMVPPWKEIFIEDEERKHSFEDAVKEYNLLIKFYPKCRYQIVQLPKIDVNERCKFILDSIV